MPGYIHPGVWDSRIGLVGGFEVPLRGQDHGSLREVPPVVGPFGDATVKINAYANRSRNRSSCCFTRATRRRALPGSDGGRGSWAQDESSVIDLPAGDGRGRATRQPLILAARPSPRHWNRAPAVAEASPWAPADPCAPSGAPLRGVIAGWVGCPWTMCPPRELSRHGLRRRERQGRVAAVIDS